MTVATYANAGLSAIEHIGYLQRAASDKEDSITQLRAAGKINNKEAAVLYLNTFNKEVAIQKFKNLAANGTAVVPTINGSFKRLAVSDVITPQITPEVYRTIKPIFSGVDFSAKRIRSASFSRFSCSFSPHNRKQ